MNELSPPDDLAHPASIRRRLTEPSFLFLLIFATSTGIACYALRGPAVFWALFREHLWLLVAITPVLAGAVLLGAFLQALVPPDYVRTRLGEGSGLRGIAIGSLIGLFVPGGPMISMPLLLAVIEAGADLAACVAFYMSWSTLALVRIIQWELPLMGGKFAAIRFLSAIPLPFLAGLMAIPLFRRFRPRASSREIS